MREKSGRRERRWPQRKRLRLRGYDYARPGAYFVTFNVRGWRRVLGEVREKKMLLSPYGRIVDRQWRWLHERYPYLVLDAFVTMPDHFHGIVVIGENRAIDQETGRPGKIKPLPELLGAFKTTSSKLIHEAGLVDFAWHKSYYDRIIRDNQEWALIRRYIRNNPARWGG